MQYAEKSVVKKRQENDSSRTARKPDNLGACQDAVQRTLTDDLLSKCEVLAQREVIVSQRVSLISDETRPRRKVRDARNAKISIRATSVTLKGPSRPGGRLPSVTLNAIEPSRSIHPRVKIRFGGYSLLRYPLTASFKWNERSNITQAAGESNFSSRRLRQSIVVAGLVYEVSQGAIGSDG